MFHTVIPSSPSRYLKSIYPDNMKLIITGATGFVATEIVRQSLLHPRVTTVVAVARKPVPIPDGVDRTKLKNVVIKDYDQYLDAAREEFAGAAACIWTVAVGPWKARMYPDFETVRKVSQDYTVAGLQAMHESRTNKPFRFLYLSGSTSERDQSKSHLVWNQYRLMRVSVLIRRAPSKLVLTNLRARQRTKS